ncbi:YpoC family protein [Bacillus sp. MRMR6]|uniref:YpoC family protein n=1 Tax=Bacillus sp. MRMR6 TaxID=1928617 RepID=UPI00111521D4|nr:hypothetical protein [Bacillus sp. MRMR6]
MDSQITFASVDGMAEGIPADVNESIIKLLSEWAEVKTPLESFYRNRDQQNTTEGMKRGLAIFIQFLFWSNEEPILGAKPITTNNLIIKPFNLEERLSFVIARPNLFHSYRQLSELMIEQEKLYAKKMALKKASKPIG